MKRGFTILELLVASALLGMLVTILTMIFNQSSIAWRIGAAKVADWGNARFSIGSVREIADNAFVAGNEGHRSIGLWQPDGQLRKRSCDTSDNTGSDISRIRQDTLWFFNLRNSLTTSGTIKPQYFKPKYVGGADNENNYQAYTVNVKSNGPDREPNTWDDIWSFPDDPNEW